MILKRRCEEEKKVKKTNYMSKATTSKAFQNLKSSNETLYIYIFLKNDFN